MALYRVVRAHRGRFGYVRVGQVLTLPDGYAKDLMRYSRPLVAACTEEEAARLRPALAPGEKPGAEPGGAPGEKNAGAGPTAVLPAAGSGSPLSSRQLGRRSRGKTSSTSGAAPG